MRQLRRPLRTLTALALVAFSLTGCMKLDLAMTVNSDDTLDGTVIVALDKSVLGLSGKSAEEAFANAEGSLSDLPEGSRTEVYDDGKYYGKKVVYDDLPFADFNSGQPGAPSITHADGKYVFTADLRTGNADLGPQAELMRPFLSSVQITFAVTFPGDVVEHDAKAVVDGRTVRWNVAVGGRNELRAVAEEGSAFPWLVVAVVGGVFGLGVIVGIVLLGIWLSRRRAGGAPADPGAPAPVAQPYPTQAYPVAQPAGPDGSGQPGGYRQDYPATQAYPVVQPSGPDSGGQPGTYRQDYPATQAYPLVQPSGPDGGHPDTYRQP